MIWALWVRTEKQMAYAAADIFCMPSVLESYSLVVMEAWLQGTPALVHADCAVTVDHCQRANAGLWFRSYREFDACLERLLDQQIGPQLGRMDATLCCASAGGRTLRSDLSTR